MELDELHVAHAATGTPGHRDAVAGGDVGVGRIQVHLARSAGCDHGVARGEGEHALALDVEHVGAEAACARLAELVTGDQVDRDVVLEDVDVRVPAHMVAERGLHRGAGCVGRMDDASMRVAAFAGEVVAELGVGFAGEGHAAVDQPLDRALAVLDHEACRLRVAKACTGDEGVLDVGFDAVRIVEHRGDAALRPVARAVCEFALGHERHTQAVRQAEGHRLAGGAAAKNEYVVLFQQDVARAGFAGKEI